MIAIISFLTPVISIAQDQTPPYDRSFTQSFEIFELCIPVLLILAGLYAVVSIFRIKAENKIRQQLIDKGIADDTLKQMLMNGSERIRLETLKWGLITGCTGVGLLICHFYPFSFITFAILFVSISSALLIFYFLSQKYR